MDPKPTQVLNRNPHGSNISVCGKDVVVVDVPQIHDTSELELRRWDDTVVLQHACNVQGVNDDGSAEGTDEECWEGSHLCSLN